MSIIKELIKKVVLSEAKKMNIAQPHSNLYIKGWGNDVNGNLRIIVGLPNDKGFSVQTNGNCPETHSILNRKSGKSLSTQELDIIGKEITAYVEKYGSSNVKSRLRKYNAD